jgi:hypothetical protein
LIGRLQTLHAGQVGNELMIVALLKTNWRFDARFCMRIAIRIQLTLGAAKHGYARKPPFTGTSFPGADPATAKKPDHLVRTFLKPEATLTSSVDRLIASVEQKTDVPAVAVKDDPPGMTNSGGTLEQTSPMVCNPTDTPGPRNRLGSISGAGRGRRQVHPEVPGLVLRPATAGFENERIARQEASFNAKSGQGAQTAALSEFFRRWRGKNRMLRVTGLAMSPSLIRNAAA